MEHYRIPIDFDYKGTLKPDDKELHPYEYNIEPFEYMNYSAKYKENFHNECKDIFTKIGDKHIPKVLAYIHQYSSYRRQVMSKIMPNSRNRFLYLLELLNSEDFFDEKTTINVLKNQFDETSLEAAAWESDFNFKTYNKHSILNLKKVLWRGHSIKIELEDNKYLSILPNIDIILSHPKVGKYPIIDDVNLLNTILTAIVRDIVDDHRYQNTEFYKTLLKFTTTDRFQYIKPDIKKLKKCLGIKNHDGLINETNYLLIQHINKYLDDNELLKEKSQGFGFKKNAISNSKKIFFFNLLLAVGLLKAPNAKILVPYKCWDDYLERKKQFRNKKMAGENGIFPVEKYTIGNILKHKSK